MKNVLNKIFIGFLLCLIGSAFAIEEITPKLEDKKPKFSLFKKKDVKKSKVVEVDFYPVTEGKPKVPFNELKVMTLEDCLDYAIAHYPLLSDSYERINAVKAGIGIEKSNYAPKLTGRVNYNHDSNQGTRIVNSHENSIGFNVGVSNLIWDFGKTTAKINMAKYNLESTQYDYDWDVLGVVYGVKIDYYKVLSALANLDIYEQNVRIQTLNYERTKAMFDEGLKSKIDVVNADVNLTDAKIQLVDARNTLSTSLIDLKNNMFYLEAPPFIVQNTENFSFLKSDYRKKVENISSIKPIKSEFKKTPDGLIMLTSGIEHNDIIQNFEFKPLVLSKQEAIDTALENRPDLKSHRMLIKVQEESLKAIKKQYAPEITGSVNWGYTKNESTYSSPLQLGASIGLGSVNPYGIHYQIKQGESYLDIARLNLNTAKIGIFWEVQTNYVNMRKLERMIPLMNQKVKATLENFELADGRYSVGLNNYVELQDALTNYNNAQLNFVEAVFNYNVARETLLKSMGVR